MKKIIILLIICFSTFPAKADYIIHLKNGDQPEVKSYKTKGDDICFEMYGGEICFPKTDILKIVEINEKNEGNINQLETITADKIKIAQSYAGLADKFYHDNDFNKAIELLNKAMEYNPSEKLFPKNAGVIYYNTGNFEKSGEMFSKALDIDSNDSFAHEYLGRSYYYRNLSQKALIELNSAIELDPDNSPLREFKDKVEKENKTDNSFSKTSQEIFLIQYDYETESRFTSVILNTLSEAYWNIVRDFSYYTKKEFKIPVIIYTKKAFENIDHPEWAGAFYDGKVRIPIGSINEQKDNVIENFIYHEVTHAIIYYYCNGRKIPAWLNEGIAKMEEKNKKDIKNVKKSINKNQFIPLRSLENSFSNLTNQNAVNQAYAQSYLAVNFIIERYSRQALIDILKKLSEDKSIEEAVSTTLFVNFNQFEKIYFEYMSE